MRQSVGKTRGGNGGGGIAGGHGRLGTAGCAGRGNAREGRRSCTRGRGRRQNSRRRRKRRGSRPRQVSRELTGVPRLPYALENGSEWSRARHDAGALGSPVRRDAPPAAGAEGSLDQFLDRHQHGVVRTLGHQLLEEPDAPQGERAR